MKMMIKVFMDDVYFGGVLWLPADNNNTLGEKFWLAEDGGDDCDMFRACGGVIQYNAWMAYMGLFKMPMQVMGQIVSI